MVPLTGDESKEKDISSFEKDEEKEKLEIKEFISKEVITEK